MDKKITVSCPSFMSLLFLLFLYLKLTGVIAWSWWLVTAPLWGGLAFILAILVVFIFIFIIAAGVSALIGN